MAQDEHKAMGRMTGEQPEVHPDGLVMRLVYMVLIALMISVAQSVLVVLTVIQFVIMVLNKRQPNENLAEFGTSLGIWIAKAARFQTAASEVKPWPWTELD
jgi:succinate-acetate transporter protein